MRCFVWTVFALVPAQLWGQTVSVKDGNVFYKAQDAPTVQITSSGLDSDPHLSLDRQLAVFVRRTPSLRIFTGLGEVDRNELWVASTSGKEPPRQVLVGHPGGFKVDDNLVLAGFSSPQFSPDAKRVYFAAVTWATSSSFRVLDVRSGQVRYLYNGLGIEVVESGRYAGYLIALKEIPQVMPGRVFRYWLLDPDGRDIGEIGASESDVDVFKSGRF